MFIGSVAGLDEADRNGFGCPNESAYAAAGELLPFERGLILHLDENPIFYVYYSSTGEWEQAVSQWREGEATTESGNESPAAGLFVPGGAIWPTCGQIASVVTHLVMHFRRSRFSFRQLFSPIRAGS